MIRNPYKKVVCAGSVFSVRRSCYSANFPGDISYIIRKVEKPRESENSREQKSKVQHISSHAASKQEKRRRPAEGRCKMGISCSLRTSRRRACHPYPPSPWAEISCLHELGAITSPWQRYSSVRLIERDRKRCAQSASSLTRPRHSHAVHLFLSGVLALPASPAPHRALPRPFLFSSPQKIIVR